MEDAVKSFVSMIIALAAFAGMLLLSDSAITTDSAQAMDTSACGRQSITKDWKFSAVDSNGKKKIFGPYDCKNVCIQTRNYEAAKAFWVLVGTCERK